MHTGPKSWAIVGGLSHSLRLQRMETSPCAVEGGRWDGSCRNAWVIANRPPQRHNLATFCKSTRGMSAMSPETLRKTVRRTARLVALA